MYKKLLVAALLFLSMQYISGCVKKLDNRGLEVPSWFLNPKQNNNEFLFGAAEGFSMEEATKNALADCASRLMVSISSESQLNKQADKYSSNEEIRQKTKQSVEKINFLNYSLSKSSNINGRFFVEVKVERAPFLNDQKQRIEILRKKISDLNLASKGSNSIQRRNDLIKIVDFGKELELKSRIMAGSGNDIGLKEDLLMISNFQQEHESLSSKIDFVIDESVPKEIATVLVEGLNKEGLKIVSKSDIGNSRQVLIKARISKTSGDIYGAKILKISINFSNFSVGKIIASNSIECSGSSSLSEKEAENSAILEFRGEVERSGVLKIIGLK